MPVTFITGGSTGIGAASVRELIRRGHNVVATGRDKVRLADLAARVNAGAALTTLVGDAADYRHLEWAVETAVERYGRLDNAIANAGFSAHDRLADGDPDRWRDMVLLNVLAPALLVRAALNALTDSHGRIVFIGSVAGFKNTPGNMYSVTKWAVTALAENTRMQVTERGVGVTLIAPGRVDTPFWDGRGGTPEGPALTADDIARAIGWAVSQPVGVDVNTLVIRPIGQPV
jgi:NADP-dependent 3-hydroxy acid dehydrogenase YdfG